jgi:hypothetical protein
MSSIKITRHRVVDSRTLSNRPDMPYLVSGLPGDGDGVSPGNVAYFKSSDSAGRPRRLYQIMSPRKFQVVQI